MWKIALALGLLVSAEAFMCPQNPSTSNCSCTRTPDPNYEITCPSRGETKFTIEMNDYAAGKNVQLNCRETMTPRDYRMIPRLESSQDEIRYFAFTLCPLPENSLMSVMSQLGITKVRNVKMDRKNSTNGILERRHLKGLDFLESIRLTSSDMSNLPDDVFFDLKNLTSLIIRSCKINIHPDLFKHTNKIQFLELSHNDIKSLPEGLFKHLNVLKTLNLWQNSLTNITAAIFEGLENLEELDMSTNNLQTLPSDVFRHLPNLKHLYMYNNNLTEIPGDIFSGNPHLKVLKLFDNKEDLKELPERMLSNLSQLTEVRLYRCNIVIVGQSLLWNSRAITNVSLESNLIRQIPMELFRDQENLLDLNLSNNKLREIPDNAFKSLRKLVVLNLDNNELSNLSGKIFESLVSLERLSIRHNLMGKIAPDAFSLMRNLQHVDFAYNNLSFNERPIIFDGHDEYSECGGFPSPLQSATNLRYLNLSHNSITEIFSDWKCNLLHLNDLDLSYNALTNIQFSDVNFVNNKITVDLRYNNISDIYFTQGDETIDESEVKRVDIFIDHNPIVCECSIFGFVKYLSNEMTLGFLNVEPGSVTCVGPQALEGWKLKDVKPKSIMCLLDHPTSKSPPSCPKDCSCYVRPHDNSLLVNCTVPVLANKLHLPNITNTRLRYTELHYENRMMNSISQLSVSPNVFNQITKLYVGKNNITYLAEDDIPRKAEILDFRHNSIGYVNDSVSHILSNLSTLREMWVSDNPIECDCENKVFLAFLQTNYTKIKDLSDVYCSNGIAVKTLVLGELCATNPAIVAVSVTIALAGMLIGILAALFYKYEEHIKVWLYAKGLCLWWVTEKELDKDKLYDAFISYSHKDEDFVVNKLAAELEGGHRPFKLCLHFRDWVAGEWIPTQIARSVEDSRRTLVVLSPNFLESVWGRMEFRAAHNRALKEGRTRVIIIVYGDIGPTDNLDPELQAYLSMNTYVKWGDPWFWDKLRYAMPHPNRNKSLNPAHNVINKKGFDDKLELIHPTTPSTPPGQNTPPAHQAHTNPLMNHVNSIPNGYNGIKHPNGTITMNGLAMKVNGNAKHSDV